MSEDKSGQPPADATDPAEGADDPNKPKDSKPDNKPKDKPGDKSKDNPEDDDNFTPKDPNECRGLGSESGADLPPDEIDKIINSMQNIVNDCQKKVDDQKIDSHSLVFMLLRIKESLDAYYNDYFPRINSFLVNAESLTAQYFAHMCSALPIYGDYVPFIEGEEDEVVDVGPYDVEKEELLKMVKAVIDNYFATGMFIKSGRMVLKDVNNCMPERHQIVDNVFTPLPKWMEFQDKVTCQLEAIRELTFKISAYIDFLKQGEMRMAPTLDLTALNKSIHSADPAKQEEEENKLKKIMDEPEKDTPKKKTRTRTRRSRK